MLTIKAGRPLIRLATYCYRANLPLLVVGKHGIGKSEILRRAADELGIECVVLDLSILEPTDLIGLPRKQGNRTVYCPPAFLPSEGKGFLVLEELNRCQTFMRAPALQLLSARRLNEYILPAAWLPVATMNPVGKAYEVDELDPACLGRFLKVKATADRDEWLAWAGKGNVHPDVVGYAESDSSIFDAADSNPRAWKYVSDFLLANGDAEEDRHLLQVALSGLVGRERAGSFLGFYADKIRPLSAEEIFSDYGQWRKRVKGWVTSGKLDRLKGSLYSLMTKLQSKAHLQTVRGDSASWKNVGSFLNDLPGDLREEAEKFFKERHYPMPRAGRRSK